MSTPPVSGYLHPSYAQSLADFGTPRKLLRSKGWVLERRIPGFSEHDAMGCYPLFVCQDWSQLYADLEDMGNELVTLSVVTNPFGQYDRAYLRRCFRDVVLPFKEHFIVDLHRPMKTSVCQHHRRYARKALKEVKPERCENPSEFIGEWVKLYANLIERHGIKGMFEFSRSSFERQLSVPGIVAFRGVYRETIVGMVLYYVQGEVGYYHLGAYSNQGYDLRASFALFSFAIEYFAALGLRWLNLGAGAGVKSEGMDGLSRFKRGWSTGTRTAYFCGRIFDHGRYSEIVKAKSISSTDYFPAYRRGEFR